MAYILAKKHDERRWTLQNTMQGGASAMSSEPPLAGAPLTEAISASMVRLYGEFYGHQRTTATTYINDNVVVCVLEDILSVGESDDIADGQSRKVLDARVAFQEGAEDAFTAEVERLTGRTVTAFLSANQTAPGIACELFFLEAPPLSEAKP